MAKATINTGTAAQPVHTRTTDDDAESPVAVLGIDGSDDVVGADAANGLDVDVTRVQGTVNADARVAGTWGYQAGVSGTENIAADVKVLAVHALAGAAGGSVSIGGGDVIPLPANTPWNLDLNGRLAGAVAIVFTGTVSYFVETVA